MSGGRFSFAETARRADGSYNFDGVFQKVRPMLGEADYVVSNLEAPMAGEEAKYTDCFYVFNTPDAYAEAIKNAGIDLISTVNNHTLDRGADGGAVQRACESIRRVSQEDAQFPDFHKDL